MKKILEKTFVSVSIAFIVVIGGMGIVMGSMPWIVPILDKVF